MDAFGIFITVFQFSFLALVFFTFMCHGIRFVVTDLSVFIDVNVILRAFTRVCIIHVMFTFGLGVTFQFNAFILVTAASVRSAERAMRTYLPIAL